MHETETERKKESNVCVRREESLLGRPELDEPRLNRNIKIIIHPGSVWVESDVVFRLQYRWPNGVLDCNLLTKLSQKKHWTDATRSAGVVGVLWTMCMRNFTTILFAESHLKLLNVSHSYW